MNLKEYQRRTLAAVGDFLDQLARLRAEDAKAREQNPEWGFDWVRRAWRNAAPPGRKFTGRKDGTGQPLPAFCLKIPTGGGKTLLALHVIDQVNAKFRRSQTGLVLWIVPTTQIYRQTLAALKDRSHYYRQRLDQASAGRTLILEKTSGFGPQDAAENLCVLLLMLPSANRKTKAQLRMFRDSGGFDHFFPREDEARAHAELLREIPNLDTFDEEHGMWGRQIKTSLGNTLRLLRPLIVLDEGHKAYSRNARATLEGFNPCAIVELSATPPREANVLVEILGRDLLAEEMVKLDLHISCRPNASWQDTLLAATEHRNRLEEEARKLLATDGTYIRPICLIQVERTGKDQRDSGLVHAEDVREYLHQHGRIAPGEVAVKSSQKDELKEVDDTGGLLSPNCGIRYIITKQALQEGWDCSFAYVLAILTRPSSRTGLTQLVGRILRQPYAHKTHNPALDESYVFCFQRRGADLLTQVRKGFGLEGLSDLEGRVVGDTGDAAPVRNLITKRQREPFRAAARDLVLPAFMICDNGGWRPVRYETDLLSRVDWSSASIEKMFDLALDDTPPGGATFRVGLDSEARDRPATEALVNGEVKLNYAIASRHLLEVVPNPWHGYEMARRVFGELLDRHPPERVRTNFVYVLEELRQHLHGERDRLARGAFADLLDSGEMRFIVIADELGFNRLPTTIESTTARQANREDGGQYLLNLFDRTDEDDLNGLENKVATYLDQQERLFFWYRNRARKDYYVQGWKRGRIYADFILTLKPDEPNVDDAFHRVFVVETKGLHLEQAADTTYKRSVFDLCNEHAKRADWADFVPAMRDTSTRFKVVDEAEWRQSLATLLA